MKINSSLTVHLELKDLMIAVAVRFGHVELGPPSVLFWQGNHSNKQQLHLKATEKSFILSKIPARPYLAGKTQREIHGVPQRYHGQFLPGTVASMILVL